MRSLRVSVLGRLLPDAHGRVLDRYLAIDAFREQVLSDMQTLQRQGADVSAFNDRYQAIATEMVKLRADIETLDDPGLPGWSAEAARLESAWSALLDDTIGARVQSGEQLEFRGLWWGLGAALVVVGGAWVVWRGRGRRRRR